MQTRHTAHTETLYPSETTGEYLTLGTAVGVLLGYVGGLMLSNFLVGLLVGAVFGLFVGMYLYRYHKRQVYFDEQSHT
jgi:tetrahydromethanopterin S-methyltransferase subunit C